MAVSGDNWGQFKAAGTTLGAAGLIAAAAGGLCVAVVGFSLFSFGKSLLGASVSPKAMVADPDKQKKLHDAEFERYIAQWNGRSLIIHPGPPKPIETVIKDPGDEGPKAPTKPTSYEGRAIIAMVLDTIWLTMAAA